MSRRCRRRRAGPAARAVRARRSSAGAIRTDQTPPRLGLAVGPIRATPAPSGPGTPGPRASSGPPARSARLGRPACRRSRRFHTCTRPCSLTGPRRSIDGRPCRRLDDRDVRQRRAMIANRLLARRPCRQQLCSARRRPNAKPPDRTEEVDRRMLDDAQLAELEGQFQDDGIALSADPVRRHPRRGQGQAGAGEDLASGRRGRGGFRRRGRLGDGAGPAFARHVRPGRPRHLHPAALRAGRRPVRRRPLRRRPAAPVLPARQPQAGARAGPASGATSSTSASSPSSSW